MQARVMYRWVSPQGVVVAQVSQGIRMTPAGPRAAYFAQVQGEQVQKDTFTCAKRQVERWLAANRVSATPVPA